MPTRNEQKELRRQNILLVALDLFVKNGYAATRIDDIAKVANMSVGLMFHYFDSNEALYIELVKIGLQGTKQPLAQADSFPPLEVFESFSRTLLHMLKEQPMVAKMFVLMAHTQTSRDVPDAARELALQVNTIEQSIPIIIKGQENHTIRQGSPLALSTAYWCAIQGIMEQLANHPETPFPEPEWISAILKEEQI